MSSTDGKLAAHPPDSSVHMDAVRGLAALTVFLGHGRGLFLKSGLHDAITGTKPVGKVEADAAAGTQAGTVQPAGGEPAPGPKASPASIGHEAVIVFFVLSGYFVGGSVIRAFRKGNFSWGRYLYQRLTRLWVALIPAIVLGVALDLAGIFLLQSQTNIYSGPAGQFDVSPGILTRLAPQVILGNVFFTQDLLCPLLGTNVSLWSLTFEFWYYIFFPLILTIFVTSSRVWMRVVSAIALLAAMNFCGLGICIEFLLWVMGAGVSLLPLRLPAKLRRPVTLLAGVVLAGAMLFELKTPLTWLVADFILGVAFTFFLWTMLHATRATVHPAYRKSAQFLSNMSYTLYLVHMPVFVFVSGLLMPVWHAWPLSAKTVAMVLPIYAFVFFVCWVMYFCFERNTDRVRNWVSGVFSRRTSYASLG